MRIRFEISWIWNRRTATFCGSEICVKEIKETKTCLTEYDAVFCYRRLATFRRKFLLPSYSPLQPEHVCCTLIQNVYKLLANYTLYHRGRRYRLSRPLREPQSHRLLLQFTGVVLLSLLNEERNEGFQTLTFVNIEWFTPVICSPRLLF
jgi:hypothetical protein